MVAGAVGEAGAHRAIFRRGGPVHGPLENPCTRPIRKGPNAYFAPLGTGAAVALIHAAAITGASSYETSDSVP